MRELRRLIRLIALLLHIGVGVIMTLCLVGVWRMTYQHSLFQRVKRWWLKTLAWLMGARVVISGQPCLDRVMWMANHVTWLDIAVLGEVGSPRFLSKSEVKRWPLIGWLATASGTLYIERGQSSEGAAKLMLQALQQGECVAMFPEGTTGDGITLKHFFARLFAPALETNTRVQPVVLRYVNQQGDLEAAVPYTGQQTLFQNLWAVMAVKEFTAEVIFLPPINPMGHSRKSLAAECEAKIREVLSA